MQIQLITYPQETDYDRIRWRAVPFVLDGEKYVTMVEEKMKGEKVQADLRRCMREAEFMSLRDAVLSVDVES